MLIVPKQRLGRNCLGVENKEFMTSASATVSRRWRSLSEGDSLFSHANSVQHSVPQCLVEAQLQFSEIDAKGSRVFIPRTAVQ